MNAVFFLANFYTGPLQGQGHGQQPQSGGLGHPWHWLQETDHGWESHTLGRRQATALRNRAASYQTCPRPWV
jgi:hypothetical protein